MAKNHHKSASAITNPATTVKSRVLAPWGYMIFCSRFGGYIRGAIIYETFSVCVQMSRNVVVSCVEGYSDVLDNKKTGGYMPFCSRFGGEGYIRRG